MVVWYRVVSVDSASRTVMAGLPGWKQEHGNAIALPWQPENAAVSTVCFDIDGHKDGAALGVRGWSAASRWDKISRERQPESGASTNDVSTIPSRRTEVGREIFLPKIADKPSCARHALSNCTKLNQETLAVSPDSNSRENHLPHSITRLEPFLECLHHCM